MNYEKFKISYISDDEIKRLADQTRKKFWDKKIPIDVEKMIESKFDISIIPLPGLYQNFNFDSFISSDWNCIYVDNDRYMSDAHYKRVRFSIAHELGHLILHKDIYESLHIDTVEDYYRFHDQVQSDQYSYLETQANKFAGYFLIPGDLLRKEFEKVKIKKQSALSKAGLNKISDDILIDYIAEDLSEVFNVSSHVIKICWQSNKVCV